ncbi:MAG: hypothetical protein A2Z14_18880 [Chloroflexi bacterium RBG_16_48_8]|nr:MAG: hypothetical protein A2Z14_18880 [Chloroflexi bacterium RBG_16_48_8]
MEEIITNGIRIHFEADERETAELIRFACEKYVQMIHEEWGLEVPRECRIYVMTSWSQFIFQSAPWYGKFLLVISLPLWIFRVRRIWQFAGGWMLRYGKRCVVGVKPPRLIEMADRSMGERIFVKEESFEHKVPSITCHELTHAFTACLRLPMWLNEGVAMVMVDKFLGKATVMESTLQALQHSPNKPSPGTYQRVSVRDQDALVYHYVRGYWITRYLIDTRPELLKNLLNRRQSHKPMEDKIASSYEMDRKGFWAAIDDRVVTHFLTN